MSTQINVIVDNGGLSEKAKRQTQANRWSKLESDNRQKVEAAGTQQRDATRAQQGIGADGRPLFGTPPAQVLRRDEPAARQLGGNKIDMLMVPDQGFSGLDVIPIKAKKTAYRNFSQVTISNGSLSPSPTSFSTELSAGPAGTGALRLFNVPSTAFSSARSQGLFLTADNGPMLAAGFSSGVVKFIVIQDESANIVTAESRLKAKDINDATFEFMLRIGQYSSQVGSENNTTTIQVAATIYDQAALTAPSPKQKFLEFFFQVVWDSYNSGLGLGYFEYEASVFMRDGAATAFADVFASGYSSNGTTPWADLNPGLPEPLLGNWLHFAAVKNASGIKVFIGGQLVIDYSYTALPSFNPIYAGYFASGTASYASPIAIFELGGLSSLGQQPAGSPFGHLPSYLHGMRVTPKALYTSNFTPPTSITSYG